MRGADPQHLGGRRLRGLHVEERSQDLQAGVESHLFLGALHALEKIQRALVAGEDGDLGLGGHQRDQLAHHRLAGLDVVDPAKGEPARIRRVAVERHHRHAARHGVVDDRGELGGVGDRDQDGVDVIVDGLGDAFGLDRRVLLRGRQPLDGDRHVDLGGQLSRAVLGAHARGEERRVVRALRDHGDAKRLGGRRARRPPGVLGGAGRGRRGLLAVARASRPDEGRGASESQNLRGRRMGLAVRPDRGAHQRSQRGQPSHRAIWRRR